MDDARKLLESLMGQTRNLPLKEAKKKKGNNFKDDNVCKYFLLGFCPLDEQLFRNTKRHLGDCEKMHSEALKTEFEAHPEKQEYEGKYCRDLIRYLETIVRTADEAVSRQARNIQAANKELEERGPNDVAKREIEKIRENCSLLLNEAEELAEAGDIEGSKGKQAIYEQTKQKADDYEAKSKQPIKEEVCEVCGLRPEDGDGMRKFSHTEGKIHIGFVKVREWLKHLRELQDKLEDERKARGGSRQETKDAIKEDKPLYTGERDKNRDRDREKDRDRGRDREDGGGVRGGGGDRESKGGDERGDNEGGGGERGGGGDRGHDRRGGGERDSRGSGDRDYRGGGDREGDRGYDRRSGGERGRDRGERGGARDDGGGGRRDRRDRSRSRGGGGGRGSWG